MTWSAQQRRKRQAAALGERYRLTAIVDALTTARRTGEPVVVSLAGLYPAAVGVVTELNIERPGDYELGGYVFVARVSGIGGTNVPLKMVRGVRPHAPV